MGMGGTWQDHKNHLSRNIHLQQKEAQAPGPSSASPARGPQPAIPAGSSRAPEPMRAERCFLRLTMHLSCKVLSLSLHMQKPAGITMEVELSSGALAPVVKMREGSPLPHSQTQLLNHHAWFPSLLPDMLTCFLISASSLPLINMPQKKRTLTKCWGVGRAGKEELRGVTHVHAKSRITDPRRRGIPAVVQGETGGSDP